MKTSIEQLERFQFLNENSYYLLELQRFYPELATPDRTYRLLTSSGVLTETKEYQDLVAAIEMLKTTPEFTDKSYQRGEYQQYMDGHTLLRQAARYVNALEVPESAKTAAINYLRGYNTLFDNKVPERESERINKAR